MCTYNTRVIVRRRRVENKTGTPRRHYDRDRYYFYSFAIDKVQLSPTALRGVIRYSRTLYYYIVLKYCVRTRLQEQSSRREYRRRPRIELDRCESQERKKKIICFTYLYSYYLTRSHARIFCFGGAFSFRPLIARHAPRSPISRVGVAAVARLHARSGVCCNVIIEHYV